MIISEKVYIMYFFFFQAEDGIRDYKVTGVQTCALPISPVLLRAALRRRLLRELPGGRRDRGGGPARDRHHLRVRAAAHLREPADAHNGADGGREPLQAQDVSLFHRA